MAIDYNRLKSVADRLITDNGQMVQLIAYDYVDHDDGSAEKVMRFVSGMGVVSNFNERDSKMFADIKANDAKLICKLPERPERGQNITANGITWRIVDFKDINPAMLSLLYILQIRA